MNLLLSVLFACGECQNCRYPEIWVQTTPTPVDDRVAALHPTDSGILADTGVVAETERCPASALTDGDTLYVAWILPSGVPDPREGTVTLEMQTACGTTSVEGAFEGGAARWVQAAPAGSSAGLMVKVAGFDRGDSCSFAAVDTAAADCPVADTAGEDTDPAATATDTGV